MDNCWCCCCLLCVSTFSKCLRARCRTKAASVKQKERLTNCTVEQWVTHTSYECIVSTNIQHQKIDSIEIENGICNKKKENGQNHYHNAGAFSFV